ncbi:MAG: penicillin-binding transpeptidase domain-containing protein [Solirubrobacteraceae bacterium]|nr:penicillin-binding transpeptidase domain-containing protein [Solirubrobacteraceae bacterium]
MVAVLVLAGGVGGYVLLSARADRAAEERVARAYADAWAKGDHAAMYRRLDDVTHDRVSAQRFAELNREAVATATATRIVPGEPSRDGDAFDLPVAVQTRLFGTFRGTIRLPIEGSGDDARIRWSRKMTIPGLRDGEELTRSMRMPPRADLLDRAGRVIARGADRSAPEAPELARSVAGSVGTALEEDAATLDRLGVPPGATVGTSGLERILNAQLIGKPGGELKAGDRTLRAVEPEQADPVRSSVSLALVRKAAEAQADAPSSNGSIVMNARTGEVLAFQGSAWSVLQPPGSVMKMVTAASALEEGAATPETEYEVQTGALGIQNSNEEPCGGTLVNSFAHSCNSVFAPLAVKIGAEKFVADAERFGFNKPSMVPGAATSTVPEPSGVGELAQSGIGQARLQATPLQMVRVTATIANGGREPEITFLRRGEDAPTRRVVSARTARQMRRLMVATITDGTGRKAAVPGVTTAGKTGTAELRATQGAACETQPAPDGAEPPPVDSSCGNRDGKSTTAWMVAFAPAGGGSTKDPLAIAVMRAGNYQGGETAAPVASTVLAAALE